MSTEEEFQIKLLQLCQEADLQGIKNLVNDFQEINRCPPPSPHPTSGVSYLAKAAASNSPPILAFLLNNQLADDRLEAPVDAAGHSVIHICAKNNSVAAMNFLLFTFIKDVDKRRMLVNLAPPKTGRTTPLFVASQFNALEVVEFLVTKCQADVEVPTSSGFTALHVSAQEGHPRIVDFLIREGKANVDAKTNEERFLRGGSALHFAASGNSPEHLEVVRILCNLGKADVNLKNADGNTAIVEAASDGRVSTVQYLLSRGASLDVVDANDQCNILHKATDNNHASTIQFILTSNHVSADTKKSLISGQNAMGSTPLHIACYRNFIAVAQLLLEHGASVNHQNADGNTPLHLSCFNSNPEMVEFLIAWNNDKKNPKNNNRGNREKADPSLVNKNGKTAKQVAEEIGNKQILDFFNENVPEGCECGCVIC